MVNNSIKNRSPFPIAILLATYNGGKYIYEQLESIRNQSCQNFMCFIHDDGSSDNTIQVINDFCSAHPEHFFFLGSSKTGGAKNNFVYMLQSVDADYIMFSDQDDVWLPEKIKVSYETIRDLEEKMTNSSTGRRNMCCCAYSDVTVADSELNILRSSFYKTKDEPRRNSLRNLLATNVCIGHTMIINRCAYEIMLNTVCWDNIYMHDWWAAILCTTFGSITYIDHPLTLYRQHLDNAVGIDEEKSINQKARNFCSINAFSEWCEIQKKHISKRRNYAKELEKLLPLESEEYEFVKEFACIEKQRKLKRISFYQRNNLFDIKRPKWIQMLFV